MARRKPIVREAHLEETARRYLRGEGQAEIARTLGVTQQTVSNDLKELQRRWREAALADIGDWKAEQLARIDALEREYWEAWERSKQPVRVQTTRLVTGEAGSRSEGGMREEEVVGDPRFLSGVQWCISERIRVLGLAAPVRQDLTSGGKPFERMSDDELIRFITTAIGGTGAGGTDSQG